MAGKKVPTDETLASLAKDETVASLNETVSNGLFGVQKALAGTIGNIKTGKQDKLSDGQQAAVDSGITAEKVNQYDRYKGDISDANKKIDSVSSYSHTLEPRLSGLEATVYEPTVIAELKSAMSDGTVKSKYPVGKQIAVPWKHNGSTYGFVWDVAHYFDGSDTSHPLVDVTVESDGSTKKEKRKAICLQAHYALPEAVEFDTRRSAYKLTSQLAAGTYNFTAESDNTGSYGLSSGTYYFVTNKSHPVGAALLIHMLNGYMYDSISIHDGGDVNETPSETLRLFRGSSGTKLFSVDSGYAESIFVTHGYSEFNASALYAYLNGNGTYVGGKERVNPSFCGSDCVYGGFSADFRGLLGNVDVKQAVGKGNSLNSRWGTIETTSSFLCPPSAVEHYVAPMSGNTGASNEGVALDIWKNAGGSSPFSRANDALIVRDISDMETPRKVWLRTIYNPEYYATSCKLMDISETGQPTNAASNSLYVDDPRYVAPLAYILIPDETTA